MKNKARWLEIDVMRGILVLFMVLYHLIFDLAYFENSSFFQRLITWPVVNALQIVIASGFLMIVGLSLALSYQHQDNFKVLLKRAVFIGAAALLITITTTILFPSETIYFGILHLIAVGIILSWGWLKLNKNWWLLGSAVIILLLGFWLNRQTGLYWWLIPVGIPTTTFMSLDYFPIFPWLGFIWFGMAVGRLWYLPHRSQLTQLQWPVWREPHLVQIGQNALLIYLLHQPVMLLLLLLVRLLAGVKM